MAEADAGTQCMCAWVLIHHGAWRLLLTSALFTPLALRIIAFPSKPLSQELPSFSQGALKVERHWSWSQCVLLGLSPEGSAAQEWKDRAPQCVPASHWAGNECCG